MSRSEQSIKSVISDSDTETPTPTPTPSHSQPCFHKITKETFTPGHNPLEKDRVFLQRIYEHLSTYRHQKLNLIYFGFLLASLQAITNVSSKLFSLSLGTTEKEATARPGPLNFIDIAADCSMILISAVVFLYLSQREVRKSARLIAMTPVIFSLIKDVTRFFEQPRTFWFYMSIHGYYNICSLIIVLGSAGNLDWRLIIFSLNFLTFVSLFLNLMTPIATSTSTASNVLMEIRIDGQFVLVLVGRLAFKYLITRILESESTYNVTKYQFLKERTLQFYKENSITASFFRSNLSKDIMICVKGLDGIVASLENSPIFANHFPEILDIMISSHLDLERIFNNLIDLQCLSDKTTLVFQPSRNVDLRNLCFHIAQEMTTTTNTFIHFDDIDFDPDFGLVTIDIVLLTKALAHLLDNAVKYANEGRIMLKVSTLISKEAQASLIPAGFLEILVPCPEDPTLQKNMALSFLSKTLSLNSLSQFSLDSVGSKALDQLDELTVDQEQVLTLSFTQENRLIKRKSFGKRESFRMPQPKEEQSKSPPQVYYKFVVEDEGYGLDPKVWNALKKHQAPFAFKENFDRRLEGKAGTGLGLLTVSKIVDRMNGNLEVRSRKGRGTAVEITLPGTLK